MKSGEKTKEKIAAAFKQLMVQRPFDNITITDITDACGLNRLTFYYHFQDKYDLMNWIFYRDVISPIRGSVNAENWPDKLYAALKVLKEDGDYYCSSVSYDRVELRRYIFEVSSEIMTEVVRGITKDSNAEDDHVSFFETFLSHGLSGILFDWIQAGMAEDPEIIVKNLVRIVDESSVQTIKNAAEII